MEQVRDMDINIKLTNGNIQLIYVQYKYKRIYKFNISLIANSIYSTSS